MHAPGTFSPPPRVSDLDKHHGTCVTHVPWCMPGSLTSGFLCSRWRGKRSQHSRRMRNPIFAYLVRDPCRWYFRSKDRSSFSQGVVPAARTISLWGNYMQSSVIGTWIWLDEIYSIITFVKLRKYIRHSHTNSLHILSLDDLNTLSFCVELWLEQYFISVCKRNSTIYASPWHQWSYCTLHIQTVIMLWTRRGH